MIGFGASPNNSANLPTKGSLIIPDNSNYLEFFVFLTLITCLLPSFPFNLYNYHRLIIITGRRT